MNNNEYIAQSMQTILEMLKDRGNDVSGVTKETVCEILKTAHTKPIFNIMINSIKVLFYLPTKFKWPELKKILEDDDDEYELLLLIVREKVSQNNLKLLNGLSINMQIFDIKELQFNISHHILVPKHEIVRNEEDIQSIIERYSLKTKYQLPHILKTDAMSRYLGLKSGDVVKITRVSPTSGEYIIYRCCL